MTECLRRAGAGRVLDRLGTAATVIAVLRRSREWLKVTLLQCHRWHQVCERRSHRQRLCSECAQFGARTRRRLAMRRVRESRTF